MCFLRWWHFSGPIVFCVVCCSSCSTSWTTGSAARRRAFPRSLPGFNAADQRHSHYEVHSNAASTNCTSASQGTFPFAHVSWKIRTNFQNVTKEFQLDCHRDSPSATTSRRFCTFSPIDWIAPFLFVSIY